LPLRKLGLLPMFYKASERSIRSPRVTQGTPGNQSKLSYYLSADNDKTISFFSSSQNVVGVGAEKKLKA
jgi:hypothetical protein